MDRSRRERRSPGASVLAPEISWSHTLRLFLVGVVKRSSLCTISTNNFGWPVNPYNNCGELSNARHSSSGLERIQLPSRCYPCGRRGTHWTFINFNVNKKVQLDATVCRHLFTATSLYMFRASQHPSSGVLKTVSATSGIGHDIGTVTSFHRGLFRTALVCLAHMTSY